MAFIDFFGKFEVYPPHIFWEYRSSRAYAYAEELEMSVMLPGIDGEKCRLSVKH
jgi:hypothetical protein